MAHGRTESVAAPRQLPATLTPSAEIGVALTTFGALFMLLGVMLFFDGALLALGNVCPLPWPYPLRRPHCH